MAIRIFATVYALWALAFFLLYAGGPFYVLGFGHETIGVWALVMLGHAVVFGLVAATARGGRILLVAALSFTALNLWPAYLYFIWLPRGLVVRHLPPELLPALHLAPLLVLILAGLGFAAAKVVIDTARGGDDRAG